MLVYSAGAVTESDYVPQMVSPSSITQKILARSLFTLRKLLIVVEFIIDCPPVTPLQTLEDTFLRYWTLSSSISSMY
jgi:hypothetical protein